MKIKKVGMVSLIAMLILLLATQTIYAQTETSKATVTFTPSVPEILNPEDPDQPYEPGEDEGTDTNNPGPLSLDFVSNLQFGDQQFSLSDQTYFAKTKNPFVQVTDNRVDPNGWKVTVSASEFKAIDNDSEILEGATLIFTNGTAVTHIGNNSPKPLANSSFELTTDSTAVKFFSAKPGEGEGTWINRWLPTDTGSNLNNSVQLKVTGGTMKIAEYESTLTWTLTTGP
ncbi:hypothetical protein A8F94_19180 [Bacillus sp. FJAT-27225]|uniref:WxL domain-containing protein n=1 Tax=Bacillus sp. FJAT-27225 TaxID=1743144 RepID=UPI00080C2F0E|nr:WxL domain-containing protein [Bacillus sp. FJAT-27225]OCA83231.1 hypothetical protein A8F94_19180 [Bacillus sp. FJAT-27225]